MLYVFCYKMFLLFKTKLKYFLCRYKRVFSVGTHAITTYNPNTLEVTNQVIMLEVIRCLNSIWILKARLKPDPWLPAWNQYFRIEVSNLKKINMLI